MAVKVGINGFGRIGRNIMRAALGSKDVAGHPYEAAMLIGHDPYDHAVHFMMMSSDDEVWHRTCSWQGTKLACPTMETSVFGTPALTP